MKTYTRILCSTKRIFINGTHLSLMDSIDVLAGTEVFKFRKNNTDGGKNLHLTPCLL